MKKIEEPSPYTCSEKPRLLLSCKAANARFVRSAANHVLSLYTFKLDRRRANVVLHTLLQIEPEMPFCRGGRLLNAYILLDAYKILQCRESLLTYVTKDAHKEEFEQDVLIELANDRSLVDSCPQLFIFQAVQLLASQSHAYWQALSLES